MNRSQPFSSSVPGGWGSIGKLTPPSTPPTLGFTYAHRRPFGGLPFNPASSPPLGRSHKDCQFVGQPRILHSQPGYESEPPRMFRRYLEQSTRATNHFPVPVLAWKTNCFYGERGNI